MKLFFDQCFESLAEILQEYIEADAKISKK